MDNVVVWEKLIMKHRRRNLCLLASADARFPAQEISQYWHKLALVTTDFISSLLVSGWMLWLPENLAPASANSRCSVILMLNKSAFFFFFILFRPLCRLGVNFSNVNYLQLASVSWPGTKINHSYNALPEQSPTFT